MTKSAPKPSPHVAAFTVFSARIRRALEHAEASASREDIATSFGALPGMDPVEGSAGADVDALGGAKSSRFVREFLALGYDPRASLNVIETMAARLAQNIEAIVELYAVNSRIRSAVTERLATQWWLNDVPTSDTLGDAATTPEAQRWQAEGFDVVHMADIDAIHAGVAAAPMARPMNVTLDELARVYERSRDSRAKVIAMGIREGARSIVDPPGMEEPAEKTHSSYSGRQTKPEVRAVMPEWDIEQDAQEPALRFRTAGLVVWSEKSIREEQEQARAFAMPSTLPARAAAFTISNGGKKGGRAWKGAGTIEDGKKPREKRLFLRVAWGGRYALPVQLSLSFMGDPVVEVVRAVLDELREDGLRDWMTLHRMAAEQGRTGHLVWTWDEHKRATTYEARIRSGNVTEKETRDAVASRLWALHGAELWVERQNDAGNMERVLVGEEPFLTIVAERDDIGGNVELAHIRINPVLYQGAHREAERKHFTPIPEAVLRLDGSALRLAAMLAFEVRWARDKNCVVEFAESDLHRLAGTYGDGRPERRDLTRARHTLHVALTNALGALGMGASFESTNGPTGRRYTIHPPQWMVDTLVHRVPPALEETRAPSLPRTGAQLTVWRKAKGWTQSRVAELLGVSERTVRSAEREPDKTLPRSMLQNLGHLSHRPLTRTPGNCVPEPGTVEPVR